MIPKGIFEDKTAEERRKELAQALMNNQEVAVLPNGQMVTKQDAAESGENSMNVPPGKLAG